MSRPSSVHWHEGGTGPALLLLNGWTASGLVWPAAWLRELERSFRVIRVDNRGSGWSRGAPTPFTLADLADDAARVLRILRVQGATVLGLSMGGMIAQELTLRHPGLVERLLLLATRPPAPAQVPLPTDELVAALRPRGRTESVASYTRSLWERQLAPGHDCATSDVLDEITATVLRRGTPRTAVLAQARAVAAWHGAGRLGRIRVPTVVLHGSEDPMMPPGNGQRVAELIPGAVYVEVPGAGHLLPYEAPDVVTAHLLSQGAHT